MKSFFSAACFSACCVVSCTDVSVDEFTTDTTDARADAREPVLQTSALLQDDPPPDQDRDHSVAENDCNDHNPQVHPGAPEMCDFVDNNCNGLTDEPWSVLPPESGFYRKPCIAYTATAAGVHCKSSGIWVCDASGHRLVCSASPASPHPEKCNDEDDDCDGEVDNAPDWPEIDSSCEIGSGGCTHSGTWVCDAYSGEPYCTAEDDPPSSGCPE